MSHYLDNMIFMTGITFIFTIVLQIQFPSFWYYYCYKQ